MTEQEKAATFIGWTPGQNHFRGIGPMAILWPTRAPDMSDPRNCWLLLEALVTRDISVIFVGDEAGGRDNYVRLDATCLNKDWEFDAMWLDNRDYRGALIKVAAAFYDAEHP